MEGAPKKSSKIEKAIRSTLAGAAFLGAIGGAEVPKEGGMPQMQSAEARESFDANKEADVFIEEIAGLRIGSGGITNEFELKRKVEDKVTMFVLALTLKTPMFSKKETGRFMGMVGPEDRARAAQLLRQRLQGRGDRENPALKMLEKEIGWGREA